MSNKISRLLLVPLFLLSISRSSFAETPKVMALADLKPGTEAIGFSVFKGVEPEPFDVVLGNIMDVLGSPYILIHVSRGPMETPLEKIGAISGMSGSPIFIGCAEKLINKEAATSKEKLADCVENGVLVGALSLSVGSFIEGGMNAALTPAEYMLGAKFGGYTSLAGLNIDNPIKINDLLIKGFSPLENGRVPLSPDCVLRAGNDLKPGSMISIFLAKGDMPLAGSGTVTWRDGDKIYAFGHPMFGTGWVSYPFSQISVSDTIQTPFGASKIPGCSVGNDGAIVLDASREVAGVVGRKASSMPLQFNVQVGGKILSLNEEIVPESPYADQILNQLPQMWLNGLVGDTSKLSLAYQARIILKGRPEIYISNVLVASPTEDPFKILSNRLTQIAKSIRESGFEYVYQKFDVDVQILGQVPIWKTEKIFWQKEKLLQTSTKAVPGETLILTIILKEFPDGGNMRQIDMPITVPEDFLYGLTNDIPPTINLVLQDGSQFVDKRSTSKPPISLDELIRRINETMNRQGNMIYVQKVSPGKAKVLSGKKTGSVAAGNNKSQTSVSGWQAVDVEDVNNISPSDQVEISLRGLPPLNGLIRMDQTMTITVQAKPAEQPRSASKRKKFLWIF